MVLRKRSRLLPWRVSFWACLALVGALLLLDRCPIELDALDETAPASRSLTIEASSDFLVLISEQQLRHTRDGEQRLDPSWTWVDMLQQEVGPVAVADIDALNPTTLHGRRFVILTRSTAHHPAVQQNISVLTAFAERGGTLVAELPEGEFRERFAADGAGGWRNPGAITLADGALPPLTESLQRIPLLTRFRGSTTPAENARTLLAMDGAPVVSTTPVGEGRVVIFDFDLSAQLHALKQGLPGERNRVVPRQPGRSPITSDLVAAPSLLGSSAPYADYLERHVVHGILGQLDPVFFLWPWPQGQQGALLISHEAHDTGGRPLWKSIHERNHDARTVTFLSGSLPQDGAPPRATQEFAGHAALLWAIDAREAELFKPYGLLGLTFARRPLPLREQLQLLREGAGPGADIHGARTRNGRWTTDPWLPWHILEAAGLRYSASYGPSPSGPQGFLFGTCQPFTPLDAAGLPFRIREIPVCFNDPSTEDDAQAVLDAIARSADEPVTLHLLTRADRFRTSPSMDAFDAWRDALRAAERESLWIGGAGEYLRYRQQRQGAELRVSSREITQRYADGSPRTLEIHVEAAADTRGLSLAIPASWADWTSDGIQRGTGQARSSAMADRVQTRTVTMAGRDILLVPLNPGFTSLHIRYTRRP